MTRCGGAKYCAIGKNKIEEPRPDAVPKISLINANSRIFQSRLNISAVYAGVETNEND